MNRYNAKMNAFAVRQLELAPSDRVLEIGFGGGVTLRPLIKGAAFVGAVDRSRDVVEWAKKSFADDRGVSSMLVRIPTSVRWAGGAQAFLLDVRPAGSPPRRSQEMILS
jgi:protein-L-isoaspartate O-methyltransferase